MRAVTAVLLAIAFWPVSVHSWGGSGTGAAFAAVRVCKPHVTSALTKDRSQKNAKRRAIQDWTAKAKAAGLKHPSWRIANNKVLKCVSRAGFFECIAHGAPCTIKQKAPTPRKRRKPDVRSGERGVDV